MWLYCCSGLESILYKPFKNEAVASRLSTEARAFIETPSDLHLQSSTWSNYNHHNTAKFLVACTPNGAICFMSPLYVGSISDVELTRCSGFIEKIDGKEGISIMVDRGFTIKDQLEAIGACRFKYSTFFGWNSTVE